MDVEPVYRPGQFGHPVFDSLGRLVGHNVSSSGFPHPLCDWWSRCRCWRLKSNIFNNIENNNKFMYVGAHIRKKNNGCWISNSTSLGPSCLIVNPQKSRHFYNFFFFLLGKLQISLYGSLFGFWCSLSILLYYFTLIFVTNGEGNRGQRTHTEKGVIVFLILVKEQYTYHVGLAFFWRVPKAEMAVLLPVGTEVNWTLLWPDGIAAAPGTAWSHLDRLLLLSSSALLPCTFPPDGAAPVGPTFLAAVPETNSTLVLSRRSFSRLSISSRWSLERFSK